MLRKMLFTAVMAVMLMAGVGMVNQAQAAVDTNIFIVLRCTVTLSVSLVDLGPGTTSFLFGEVSAGTTVYSTGGVTVRNDSMGAISSWELNIDNASLGTWSLADRPGINTVAIYGVFQKTYNESNFDIVTDTFSTVGKMYSATGAYACNSYIAGDGDGAESRMLPYMLGDSSKSDRKLWIKMLTPLAVSNAIVDRTIKLVVTAKMAE